MTRKLITSSIKKPEELMEINVKMDDRNGERE